MDESRHAVLMKKDFGSFISSLAGLRKLAAPVAKGYDNYSFQYVDSAERIALKYIPTILPPKKYFMPQRETLLEFNTSNGPEVLPVVQYERLTLFGVHTCDLAGIQCLNTVFSVRPRDYNYLHRKRMIDIIGLECNEYCDEHASCSLVSANLPNGGYDLFFTDLGDYFIIHVNTQAGEELIDSAGCCKQAGESDMKELALIREKKRTVFMNEVPIDPRSIPRLFDACFESPVWKELGDKCLACGNCTNVCPTCYCFDIMDETDLDPAIGRRCRIWDSCQLDPFARVAGGENFRKERSARQRHRYYRKFRYPVSKFARFFCTGCGRCSRACMAGIRLKETLKSLVEEGDYRIWKKLL